MDDTITPNDESVISSLDDDESLPIKEMIETVVSAIVPNKENFPKFRRRKPTTSGPSASRSGPSGPGKPSGPAKPVTAAPATPKPGQKTDTGPVQGKDKANTPAEKDARTKAAKDKADKAGSPPNMAALAALGIAATAATALIAAALAGFIASDGAHIKFKSITGENTTSDAIPSALANLVQRVAPTVTTLEVTWELLEVGNPGGIASAVKVLEGDKIEWKNTGLEKLDGKDITVVRVKSENVFIVESGLTDSSQINIIDIGDGYIHTSYDDQLNQAVDDAATGAGNIINKATGGLAGKIGTIIGIVIGVVLFLVIGGLLLKFMGSKKSSSNNTQS